MNTQEILANAPYGATHVDMSGRWYKLTFTHRGFMMLNNDGCWDYCNPATDLRSLADIRRIAELEADCKDLQECFDSCYEELRLTRDELEQSK